MNPKDNGRNRRKITGRQTNELSFEGEMRMGVVVVVVGVGVAHSYNRSEPRAGSKSFWFVYRTRKHTHTHTNTERDTRRSRYIDTDTGACGPAKVTTFISFIGLKWPRGPGLKGSAVRAGQVHVATWPLKGKTIMTLDRRFPSWNYHLFYSKKSLKIYENVFESNIISI